MRKSIPLILMAAMLVAPAALAQSADQNANTGKSELKVKPSADTPAKQKERNQDYSKVPGKPGGKSGPAAATPHRFR